jgi:hypothetical protein
LRQFAKVYQMALILQIFSAASQRSQAILIVALPIPVAMKQMDLWKLFELFPEQKEPLY